MDIDGSRRLDVATEAARAGADRALESFRGDLEIQTKSSPTDVVTAIDRAAQDRIYDVIEAAFPDEPIVGEEGEGRKDVPRSGAAWIVDPIDGTANYVRGMRFWTTAVAAIEDGEPIAAAVVAPALGDEFTAGSGPTQRSGEPTSVSNQDRPEVASVCPTLTWPDEAGGGELAIGERLSKRFGNWRRYGSAQLELALVADGGLDAAISGVGGAPWDTVAGAHLVRAAGGRVTDASGERWRHDDDSLIASNARIHDEAEDVIRTAGAGQSAGAR